MLFYFETISQLGVILDRSLFNAILLNYKLVVFKDGEHFVEEVLCVFGAVFVIRQFTQRLAICTTVFFQEILLDCARVIKDPMAVVAPRLLADVTNIFSCIRVNQSICLSTRYMRVHSRTAFNTVRTFDNKFSLSHTHLACSTGKHYLISVIIFIYVQVLYFNRFLHNSPVFIF